MPDWLRTLLDLAKIPGPKALAIAAGCGIYFWLLKSGTVPTFAPWVVPTIAFVGILSACLTVVALFSWINRSVGVHAWLDYVIEKRQAQQTVRDYIPHMTQKERDIVAYLLAKNQKVLEVEYDGGYAATLISRRIIVPYGRQDKVFRGSHMPMVIPDHVWEVLKKHESEFLYKPPPQGVPEALPWRVHWMER